MSNASPVGRFPPKFERCFDNMAAADRAFIAAYSDFQAGHDKFMDFLESKRLQGVDFTFANLTNDMPGEEKLKTLDDFAQGRLNVLVLGVGMYEGVSILRASQFHILDPMVNFKDLVQLMGRVVRLHSHEGLPKERQVVTFYHYIASFDAMSIDETSVAETISSLPQDSMNSAARWQEKLKLYKESKTYRFTTVGLYLPMEFLRKL